MRRALRTLLLAATALLLGAATTILAPLPAWATVSRLCYGYTACSQAGMSSSGYAQHNGTMYWRMYSGHNCTNYAAYRMVLSGLPNSRPWVGGGNATYWGSYMSNITDDTPTVGAVAWWRAGVYPAGSAGHVAYVEKVISPTEIIVSQDSWGGDFSWARITKSGSGWPSGFVHFNDVKLQNTAKPTISGQAKVGSVLSATAGTWKPGSPTTSYQWRVAGDDVVGATSSTLTVTKAMLDKRVRVAVTAKAMGYPATSALSDKTEQVLPGQLKASVAPSVSGEPRVDQTLTGNPGTWSPSPDKLKYQWLADGAPVADATSIAYTLTPEDVGKALSLRVTAKRSGFTPVVMTTTPSVPVARAVLAASGSPSVEGEQAPGEILTLDVPSVSPDATRSVQWTRDGDPIAGATATTYELTSADLGHRVRARIQWVRDGYTDLVLWSERPLHPVRALPDVTVGVEKGDSRLTFTTTARVRGLDAVPAVVRVRSHHQVLAEKPLNDGVAVLRLKDLAAGTRTYHVVVRATDVTDRVVVDRVITIR